MALNLTIFLKITRNIKGVYFCSTISKNERDISKNINTFNKERQTHYPEEPTTCCMSGCTNCVWIKFAEELKTYFNNGGEKALEEIHKRVTDPNMKAFLLHELRMKNIK